MSRDNLLDFYREIVNSEKSFGIDYKNLSKELIARIDKAIEYIKENSYLVKDKELNGVPIMSLRLDNCYDLLEILEAKNEE